MIEFLQAAISFPAVIFTALLAFVVLFWSLVLMGGSDPHALDFDGAADGHFDIGDHGGHGDIDHAGSGWFSWIFAFMNVGLVPVSVVGSSLVMFGWIVAMLMQLYAAPLISTAVGVTGAGIVSLLCAGAASVILTGLATRPFRGLFDVETFEGGEKLIDQVCTISTTHVDADFGQASFKTGGAPLILSVRCPQANSLSKGVEAVIIGYDAEKRIYIVGDLDPVNSVKKEVIDADPESVAEKPRSSRAVKGRARSG